MSDNVFVAATNNREKIPELAAVVSRFGCEVITLAEAGIVNPPDPDENGTTFADNARIKARAVYELCKRPVIADDSGLEVDALDGRPGVFSARYAEPEKRIPKLLAELDGVAAVRRTARFVCAICCITGGGDIIEAQGCCEGSITFEARGGHGFGYDPVFLPDGYGKTFGEMSADEKNGISHRANALRALAQKLKGRI